LQDNLDKPTLDYKLADGFHRLLVHGLADFHGLLSKSIDEEDGTRRTTLRFPKGKTPEGAPEFSCGDVLMALETVQPLTPQSFKQCMSQHVPHGDVFATAKAS
jgi:hypothetical protein